LVISWFDPVEGQSRDMCRVDVQKMGQAPGRRPRCAVPGSPRQRSCGRRAGLPQGTAQQRHTDASLQRCCRPGSGPLPRGGILSNQEMGFHRPALRRGAQPCRGRQLPGRRPDHQRPRRGGGITAQHSEERVAGLLKMERVPASDAHCPLVAGHDERCRQRNFRRWGTWRQPWAVPRRMAALAAGGGWGTISANLPLCPRAPRLLHAAFCCLSGHAQARWASQVRTVDS